LVKHQQKLRSPPITKTRRAGQSKEYSTNEMNTEQWKELESINPNYEISDLGKPFQNRLV